ncbi:MAG TPA: hypothetical protein VL588_04040 [Bdellovibrionota bacterium]|jgi:hypothetical protein|nr:hypothetical protein [Bdellovibrionota bacterium]
MKLNPHKTDALLTALLLLDIGLTINAFLFPAHWFQLMHGVTGAVDPEGFLQRIGGSWAAFALFQAIALFRWRERPHWLAVVAGLRLSELFADWVLMAYARDLTILGKIGLGLSPPVNVFCAWYLLRAMADGRRSLR